MTVIIKIIVFIIIINAINYFAADNRFLLTNVRYGLVKKQKQSNNQTSLNLTNLLICSWIQTELHILNQAD